MVKMLKHVTSNDNIPSIIRSGLRAHTCLSGNDGLTEYYAETIEDDDEIPVILGIDPDKLDHTLLQPDINGVEEPIMSLVRGISNCRDEEALYDAWMGSTQDWHASLKLIGSVSYSGIIASLAIQILDQNTGVWSPLITREHTPDDKLEP